MADIAHRLTDEKLEEMEKRLSAWEPKNAPALWAKVLIPDETVIFEWEQPDSTNTYSAGDKVTHNGKTWMSNINNNSWEPGVYGWTN